MVHTLRIRCAIVDCEAFIHVLARIMMRAGPNITLEAGAVIMTNLILTDLYKGDVSYKLRKRTSTALGPHACVPEAHSLMSVHPVPVALEKVKWLVSLLRMQVSWL